MQLIELQPALSLTQSFLTFLATHVLNSFPFRECFIFTCISSILQSHFTLVCEQIGQKMRIIFIALLFLASLVQGNQLDEDLDDDGISNTGWIGINLRRFNCS